MPELPVLLEASGRLELVDGERSATLGAEYRFHASRVSADADAAPVSRAGDS